MSDGMKVLNVLGIIFAWILSIALVLMLFVSPILMSSLSVVTPENLKDMVLDVDITDLVEAMEIEGMTGEEEQLAELLSTDAVQEIYEVYVSGMFGALDGDLPQTSLSEEKLEDIIHDNIDELYELAVEESPELADLPEEEAKDAIEDMISVSLEEVIEQMPSPEDLVEELEGQSSEMETALEVLQNLDTIKFSLIATLVVLSGLIFVCRLFGFRGFRWLSVDLFVATGLSALICIGLSLGTSLMGALVADSPIAGLFAGELMSSLVSGVYIRTGVMLVAAVGLLVAYIFIKKNRAKKANSAVSAAEVQPQINA